MSDTPESEIGANLIFALELKISAPSISHLKQNSTTILRALERLLKDEELVRAYAITTFSLPGGSNRIGGMFSSNGSSEDITD